MTDDDDTPRRRLPAARAILSLALLILPVAGVTWWLYRPKADDAPPGPALADLEPVCLGRVDGLNPVASLEPPVPGKVAAVLVTEGQWVPAGAPLLKLDDEAFRLREREAAAAVAGADVEVEAAKQEVELFPLRKATLDAAAAAAADRVAAARRLLEEKKTAKGFGTVTAAELIAAEAEVRQCEQLEAVERSRVKEAEATKPALKVRAAEARRAVARVALEQAQKGVRDCVLTAPAAGTVLRVQASAGEAVAPGTPHPPVSFRPDGPLVVRAELEQEFLGRVKPGMRAAIRDDARADSPTWPGKVLRVGQVVARRRMVLLEPGELNDVRTVECVFAFDAPPDGLLVGQRMRVRVGRSE
jgi:multidrug resistance efflux pump